MCGPASAPIFSRLRLTQIQWQAAVAVVAGGGLLWVISAPTEQRGTQHLQNLIQLVLLHLLVLLLVVDLLLRQSLTVNPTPAGSLQQTGLLAITTTWPCFTTLLLHPLEHHIL